MQWWGWVTVGAILLGSELTFVNAQFYLVFVGGAALIVGLLGFPGGLPPAGVRTHVPQPAGDQRRTGGRDRDPAADIAAGGNLQTRAPGKLLERGQRRSIHHRGRHAGADRARGRPGAGGASRSLMPNG